jgi:hypothetical protein
VLLKQMFRAFAIVTVWLMASAAVAAPRAVDRVREGSAYVSELGKLASKHAANVSVRALGGSVESSFGALAGGVGLSAADRKALTQLSSLHGRELDAALLDELQARCEDLEPALLDAIAHGQDDAVVRQSEPKMKWCAAEALRLRGEILLPPVGPP